MTNTICCWFTEGLDELPTRKQRNPFDIARQLARTGRFSVFEATANQIIAETMDWLFESGWFDFNHQSQFPWTHVTLTELGRTALGREA